MKSKVLKLINWTAFITFLIGACSLDTESMIVIVIMALSLGWLVLSAWANGLFDWLYEVNQ